MSNVTSTSNTTPVLPIIGLAAQQKDLRDNSTKWKVAAAALAAIGAAVAAAAGVAFAVFKAIPVAALAGGVVAGVAFLGLAILVYYKKVSSIMTAEQLLEAIKNAALKPINDARALVKELAKLLPEGDKELSKEELKKLTDKIDEHEKADKAYRPLLRDAKFDEEAKKLVAQAVELKSKDAEKLQSADSASAIISGLIDFEKVLKADKDATAAAEKVMKRLAPFVEEGEENYSSEAARVYDFVRDVEI